MAAVEGQPEHIVGIGASAGGLESLQRLFQHVDPDLNLAYVVVQHLSPDFDSVMDELLSRHTSLQVTKAQHGEQVQAGHVYLIPPGKEMIISGGALQLSDRNPQDGLALPIDTFLRSLAADAGQRAVAIILSGTGSDGSRGCVRIAEAGGGVLAESPESARFDGMPSAAINTGVVDKICHAEELGDALRAIAEASTTPLPEHPDQDPALKAIFRHLQRASSLDFSLYKPSTVGRRIQRRMLLAHHGDVESYLRQLDSDPAEVDALYRDLLIGVTRFMRDEKAFRQIASLLKQRVRELDSKQNLRMWVAACASGEEVYSLVILACEAFREMAEPPRIKVFATDVHEGALRTASRGLYDEESLSAVPDALRERYFHRHEHGWQIDQELRNMVVFARHDLLRDAPFLRMDLISCRNFLIYLNPEAQKKALTVCHFGLKERGLLFLGSSEAPTALADEFEAVDNRWRIYRKRRDVRLLHSTLLPMARTLPKAHGSDDATAVAKQAEQRLLSRYSPPSILIGPDQKLLHTFGGGARFLTHSEGAPSLSIMDLLEGDLRFAVATTLPRARKVSGVSVFKGLSLEGEEGPTTYDLEIEALYPEMETSPILLTLCEQSRGGDPAAGTFSQADISDAASDRIRELESELSESQQNLQTAMEEMEASNEELQAMNEELMASNEELQSTNEELQSVNEELYSINAEYQARMEELREVTADLNQLLEQTQVHTLFLDDELKIRRFTTGIAEIFDLQPADEGRPIQAFSPHLPVQGLVDRLAAVIETGDRWETTVNADDGRQFLLRLLPYLRGDRSAGVLLTLLDITELSRAREQRDKLSDIVDATPDFVAITDVEGRILSINPGGMRMLGLDDGATLPETLAECQPSWSNEIVQGIGMREASESGTWTGRTAMLTADGEEIPVSQILLAHRSGGDGVAYYATIARDLSDVVRMMEGLQKADEHKNEFIALLAHELRNPLQAMRVGLDLMGDQEPEQVSDTARMITHQIDQLGRLVEDLMDVARISRGKLELRREAVNLSELVERTVAAGVSIVGRRRELDADIQSNVWVDGDPARVEQMLSNLLTNASKYSDPSSPIHVTVAQDGERVELRVRDEGIGLSEDDIEDIFQPFVQKKPSEMPGLGLGLTLIRQLMELHGGEVQASSEGPGKGSCFVLRFPAIEAPGTEARPVAKEPALPLEGRRIVLVDDNKQALDSLARLLGKRGADVRTAETGRDGIAKICDDPPEAAVIDIGLPDMEGHQVVQAVREKCGEAIALVALTGYGQEEVRKKAMAAGYDDFIVKPASLAEVEAALERQLKGKQTSPA